MSKPVRLSDHVYERLEKLTDGFDTPSDTILKILNEYEYLKSYQMVNTCVQNKIQILIDEPIVDSQNISILMHYNSKVVETVIKDIIKENQSYLFKYEILDNGILINVKRA